MYLVVAGEAGFLFDFIFCSVAFPEDTNCFCVVQQTVKQRGCESAVAVKRVSPFFVGQVGGNDCGAVLVAAADNLENEVCGSFVKREVAEFIKAEHGWSKVFAQFPFAVACFSGGDEVIYGIKCRGEKDLSLIHI